MKLIRGSYVGLVVALGLFSAGAVASDSGHGGHAGHAAGHEASGAACEGFGPQTPRDIDSQKGENEVTFAKAPDRKELNLCNIHFHKNAEHKAKAFSIYAGDGDGHGNESGYQCNISKELSQAELAATAKPVCKSEHGELKPGDTIEVHWVHSSCDVKPGKGLESCLTETCSSPALRVETQVFTLVNDPSALDFNTLGYDGDVVNGFHQAKAIPDNTGTPVEFAGSTTGPKWSEQVCSPLKVTWSVRPQCAKVNIATVGKWCESNVFEEDHGHGVRKLVTNPKLLSNIK